jgi:hypothetical protein
MPHEPTRAAETAGEAMLIAAKAVEAARLDERERCATIAENTYLNDIGVLGSCRSIQQAVADAIRNSK